MPPEPVDIRTLTTGTVPDAWAVLTTAFGFISRAQDEAVEFATVDPARFYRAHDGDRTVGAAGSFDLRMAVPGAVTSVAGVTWVGVLPTHRRRGVLRSMMRRQLDDLHAAGTAVAALWASQGAIYQRFGYGPAAWNHAVEVPSGAAFTRDVEPGPLWLVDPTVEEIRPTYDAVYARTPGWYARDDAWWAMRMHDPEHDRDGFTAMQCVRTDGGYALYSVKEHSEPIGPAGTVRVIELVAETPAAHARLWRYLLDIDLIRSVVTSRVPADRLLHGLLAEPRAARAHLRDALWVRLVDVPAALAARRYAAPVDVVLEVADEVCPWNAGTYRLVGDRTSATCEPTDAAADLRLTATDLGAAYLGGTPLHSRAVDELSSDALATASTAFGPVGAPPSCPLTF